MTCRVGMAGILGVDHFFLSTINPVHFIIISLFCYTIELQNFLLVVIQKCKQMFFKKEKRAMCKNVN